MATKAMRALGAAALVQAARGYTLAFYEADDVVEQHARIDLDVQELSELTGNGEWEAAWTVYSEGKYSDKGEGVLRTLRGFSTGLAAKVNGEGLTPLPDYELFTKYYGSPTYADEFVVAALNGTGEGEDMDPVARDQLAKKGVQYQVVPMYVLYELAKAKFLCDKGESGVINWDEGAAFYIGSLIGPDGTGSGQLLYTLAEKRCLSFGTCGGAGDESRPDSNENARTIEALTAGREALLQGDCETVGDQYTVVRKQLQISLLQATLLYATKSETDGIKAMAEGWAFVAGVLPYIDEVDADAALAIREQLELFAGSNTTVTSAEEVHKDVYKVISGLCITCEELGVANVEGAPECNVEEAAYESCSDALMSESSGGLSAGAIAGLAVAGVVVIGVLGGAAWYVNGSSSAPRPTANEGAAQPDAEGVEEGAKSPSENAAAKV